MLRTCPWKLVLALTGCGTHAYRFGIHAAMTVISNLTQVEAQPTKEGPEFYLRFEKHHEYYFGNGPDNPSSSRQGLVLTIPEGSDPQQEVTNIELRLRRNFQTGGALSLKVKGKHFFRQLSTECEYESVHPCTNPDDEPQVSLCYNLEKGRQRVPSSKDKATGDLFVSVQIYGIAEAAFFHAEVTPMNNQGVKGRPMVVAFSTMPPIKTSCVNSH